MSFSWSVKEWERLAKHLNKLIATEVVEGLNRLLVDVLRGSEDDPEGVLFVQTFLSRYISRSRPLSGYFIVCCVIEAQWTILTQALIPGAVPPAGQSPEFIEAAAANRAWKSLVHEPILDNLEPDESFNQTVRETFGFAMQSFSNLLVQIEEMDTQPSEDSYAWETMSESLVGL